MKIKDAQWIFYKNIRIKLRCKRLLKFCTLNIVDSFLSLKRYWVFVSVKIKTKICKLFYMSGTSSEYVNVQIEVNFHVVKFLNF